MRRTVYGVAMTPAADSVPSIVAPRQVPADAEGLRADLGGPLEAIGLGSNEDGVLLVAVVAEDAKLAGRPVNEPASHVVAAFRPELRSDRIAGPAVLMGVGGDGEACDLDDEAVMMVLGAVAGMESSSQALNRQVPEMRARPLDVAEALDQWTPPEPHRLPELRLALMRQLLDTSEIAKSLPAFAAHAEKVGLGGPEEMFQAVAELHAEEAQRLAKAQLFFMAQDKTELARAGAETLPWDPVAEEELPAPWGLIVFAEPIAAYQHDVDAGNRLRVPVVAVSWGPTTVGEEGLPGVSLSAWTALDAENFAAATKALHGKEPTAEEMAELVTPSGMFWDSTLPIAYGRTDEEGKPLTDSESTDEVVWLWLRVALSAMLIMRQERLVEREEVPQPRAIRRRGQRHGVQDQSPVTVVRLRARPTSAGAPVAGGGGKSGREYSHRWPVRAHWRRVRYGKGREKVDRRLFPWTVAGPKDKPFRMKDRVFVVKGDGDATGPDAGGKDD